MGRSKSQFLGALLLIVPLPAMIAMISPSSAAIAVDVSVGIAPPALPVYEQPPVPGPGYLWMPGYWAWNGTGYYWVPGTWVLPPRVGLLWTPPWWGWADGVYVWHAGYWGPHVGFYGGINYGFGYSGRGYDGGHWDHDKFFYNRSVNNIRNANITNVYSKNVVGGRTVNRISFNGGRGGVNARPTRAEQGAERDPHAEPTSFQTRQINAARSNPDMLASSNRGQPVITKTNFSARRVNDAGNGVKTTGGRGNFTPAPTNVARTAPRANEGERREAPQRGGEQKGERGKRQ